jgi:L-2-hydroxyglutarate oxidase LhgO
MNHCETIVIGAGVIGLAVARKLAKMGKEVLVLEAQTSFGTITSSRNSSVVHAGIYYSPGSLKAQMCVQGKQDLYRYLQAHHIDHQQCGKIIVATSHPELDILTTIMAQATTNGVHDLVLLTDSDVRALEPNVHALGGLLSPSTGIVDVHGYMRALLGDFEDNGGMVAYDSLVLGGRQKSPNLFELDVRADPANPTAITCVSAHRVINAAGLVAPGLTNQLLPPTTPLDANQHGQHYAKGNYFALSGPSPFRRLIYPVPVAGGLGVHATLDLQQRIRFGPDVEWVDDPHNYTVDVKRADSFCTEIRKYYPDLPDDSLSADYSGIRPKLHPQGTPAGDFVLWDGAQHGTPSLIACLGIESPGLTSSLAIADRVVAMVEGV